MLSNICGLEALNGKRFRPLGGEYIGDGARSACCKVLLDRRVCQRPSNTDLLLGVVELYADTSPEFVDNPRNAPPTYALAGALPVEFTTANFVELTE